MQHKYIIVAYKTVIYILNSTGKFFTKGNITFTPQGKYYTLIPYKVIKNDSVYDYHFIIGYLGDDG